MMKHTNIMLAAQDVFYEEKGAYTGEISPSMLTDVSCKFVIIGHSERRQYFNETDEIVNRKIKAAQKGGLSVIFCIGESLAEREEGKTFNIIEREMNKGLDGTDIENIVIAYEPIWAIGTGRTATPEQAQEVHTFIRKELRMKYGNKSDDIRIIYGGSVTPENIDSLMACADIDGALVGGASLKTESFVRIVKFTKR
jgi:triosephosphate isomerase